jgi:hypothetical protein
MFAEQEEFKNVVEQVNYRGHTNSNFNRKEDGEYRGKQSTQPKTREQGKRRAQESYEAYNQVVCHLPKVKISAG